MLIQNDAFQQLPQYQPEPAPQGDPPTEIILLSMEGFADYDTLRRMVKFYRPQYE